MTPGIAQIDIARGLPWAEQVNFTASGGAVPTDLTGCVLAATIRPAQGQEPAVDLAVEVTHAESGVVLLGLTAAQTLALSPGTQVWDLQITDRSGRVVPVLTGRAEIRNLTTYHPS